MKENIFNKILSISSDLTQSGIQLTEGLFKNSQLCIAVLITMACLISLHQLYSSIVRPMIINYFVKVYSGIIGLKLASPVIKKIRRKDGTYIEKIIDYTFPEVDKVSGGVEVKFKEVIATKEYIENSLPILSNEFKIKFIEVHELSPMHFLLLKDQLPDKVELLRNPPFHSMQLGCTNQGEDVVVDTTKQFSFFLGNPTGKGKTEFKKAITYSFLRSVDYEADIVIFDTKEIDYVDMIENYNALYFDMSTLEGMEKALRYLENTLLNFYESRKVLKKHGLKHFESARRKGIELPLKRMISLMDEPARYLNPDESSSKEEKKVKQSLVDITAAILAQFRVSGCPIIISSQRVTKDELAIPYDNFQVQLFGDISKEMDAKYRYGRFFKSQLGVGQWTVKDGFREATRIRSLFLPGIFLVPNLERVSWQRRTNDSYIFYKKNQVEIYDNLYQLAFTESEVPRNYFVKMEDKNFQRIYEEAKTIFGENHIETKALESVILEREFETSNFEVSLQNRKEEMADKINKHRTNFKILEYKIPSSKKYVETHLVAVVYEEATKEIHEVLIFTEEKENIDAITKKVCYVMRRSK